MLKAALSPGQAARLVKVLNMLGSDHDGEVAAAGRLADRLLRQASLTWGDVIKVERQLTQRFPSARPNGYERAIHATLRDGHGIISTWETEFLSSLIGRKRLTDKQASKLSEIIFKVAQARRAAA